MDYEINNRKSGDDLKARIVHLGEFFKGWKAKLVKKIAHRIPHDYRRSAARNLSRAGVPKQVIMALCGWKTRSVFDRYRIVAERDLSDGLAKLAEATETPTPATQAVVPFTVAK